MGEADWVIDQRRARRLRPGAVGLQVTQVDEHADVGEARVDEEQVHDQQEVEGGQQAQDEGGAHGHHQPAQHLAPASVGGQSGAEPGRVGAVGVVG